MHAATLLLAIFVSGVVTACGGDTITVEAPTYLASLTVTADPPVLAPTLGKGFYTQQFYVTANFSDGTDKDASGVVTWSSDNTDLMSIDQSGLGTINSVYVFNNDLYGDVGIWASYGDVFDSAVVTISPPAPGGQPEEFGYDIVTGRAL